MKNLSEEDEEAYKKQFSRSIKLGMTPDSIEGMYTKAHADIRADPSAKVKVDKKVTKKRWTAAKIGLEARNAKVAAAKVFLAQIKDQKDSHFGGHPKGKNHGSKGEEGDNMRCLYKMVTLPRCIMICLYTVATCSNRVAV